GLNGGLLVSDLAIDPLPATTLYIGTKGSWDGLIKSTDGGADWSRLALTPGEPRFTFVYALAIDPQTPATVYGATIDGPYKSTDGGSSCGNGDADRSTNAMATATPPNPPTDGTKPTTDTDTV